MVLTLRFGRPIMISHRDRKIDLLQAVVSHPEKGVKDEFALAAYFYVVWRRERGYISLQNCLAVPTGLELTAWQSKL